MSPLKRKLTFLIIAAALAASAAGAYAATQASSVSPRQAFLSDVAHRLHVTPARLRQALAGALADRLSALVASGRLTKAQASAIEQRMRSGGRLPGFGWLGMPGYGRMFHRGFGPGWFAYAYPPTAPGVQVPPGMKVPPGMMAPPAEVLPPMQVPPPMEVPRGMKAGHGHQMMPFPGPAAFGLLLPGAIKATVRYLGIRPPALRAQIRSGKSLAEIARAQGKSAGGLERPSSRPSGGAWIVWSPWGTCAGHRPA